MLRKIHLYFEQILFLQTLGKNLYKLMYVKVKMVKLALSML